MQTSIVPKTAVLVAESSVLTIIGITIQSLIRNSNVDAIKVIVPDRELKLFREKLIGANIELITETTIIPKENLEKIRAGLGEYSARAGWYIQQFLKLEYARFSYCDEYVIWDADTILLKRKIFNCANSHFSVSGEFHQPYFQTLKALTGIQRQAKKSFISQYMIVRKDTVLSLTELISPCEPTHWYLKVIDSLPLEDLSEFSEYETYGNFVCSIQSEVRFSKEQWFRHGAAIIAPKDLNELSLSQLQVYFRRYNYVAFERHTYSKLKQKIIRLGFKLSNLGILT